MNGIKLTNVYKSFGEKQVISDFSAFFPYGGVSALLGKSGVGKTTLLNLITGLAKPDSGTISGVPEKISAVFQENRLCEEYNAFSNLKLITGKGYSTKKAKALFESLGLRDGYDKPVRLLSGGMRRRVAIARALAAEFDLIVLDEPFKELDVKTKKEVMETVRNAIAGKTALLVTHDPAEAAFFNAKVLDFHSFSPDF